MSESTGRSSLTCLHSYTNSAFHTNSHGSAQRRKRRAGDPKEPHPPRGQEACNASRKPTTAPAADRPDPRPPDRPPPRPTSHPTASKPASPAQTQPPKPAGRRKRGAHRYPLRAADLHSEQLDKARNLCRYCFSLMGDPANAEKANHGARPFFCLSTMSESTGRSSLTRLHTYTNLAFQGRHKGEPLCQREGSNSQAALKPTKKEGPLPSAKRLPTHVAAWCQGGTQAQPKPFCDVATAQSTEVR